MSWIRTVTDRLKSLRSLQSERPAIEPVIQRKAPRWPRNTPAYEYSRLHPGDDGLVFRVLELAPGVKGQPLKGALSTRVIPIEPSTRTLQYEALSYCWGQGTKEKFIEVGGKVILITSNLYDALQYLRFERVTRTLWIDQICINQSDTEERNQQVQQMGDIYCNATSVTAWLGSATIASDFILGSLSRVDDLSADLTGFYTSKELQEGHPIYESIKFHLGASVQAQNPEVDRPEPIWPTTFKHLETLLASPWFKRIRIVQEAGLARSLFFQAGDQSAS